MFKRAVEKADVAKWCLYWSIVLRKVTLKISGRYQKFMATNGDANSMVESLKPTAMALVASDGKMLIKSVIVRMIERKTKKIFAEKRPLCKVFAKAGI